MYSVKTLVVIVIVIIFFLWCCGYATYLNPLFVAREHSDRDLRSKQGDEVPMGMRPNQARVSGGDREESAVSIITDANEKNNSSVQELRSVSQTRSMGGVHHAFLAADTTNEAGGAQELDSNPADVRMPPAWNPNHAGMKEMANGEMQREMERLAAQNAQLENDLLKVRTNHSSDFLNDLTKMMHEWDEMDHGELQREMERLAARNAQLEENLLNLRMNHE
jgi:hypothetical protein